MKKNITYILINLVSVGLLLFVDGWNELYFGIIAILTVLFTMTRYLLDERERAIQNINEVLK